MLNPSDVTANIRDLIIYIHRSNILKAETTVSELAAYLKTVMQSEADPESIEMRRTQQTMFAIDDVRMLLAQHDFSGAMAAARDAAKEWRQLS